MSFKSELSNFQKCDKCGKSDAYDFLIFTQATRQRTNQIIIHVSCLKKIISSLSSKTATCPAMEPIPGDSTGENAVPCGAAVEPGETFCTKHSEEGSR